MGFQMKAEIGVPGERFAARVTRVPLLWTLNRRFVSHTCTPFQDPEQAVGISSGICKM
jgi:hypothetical protein